MRKLLLPLILSFLVLNATGQKYELRSPDGKLTAGITVDRVISAELNHDGNNLLSIQKISLEARGSSLFTDLRVKNANRRSADEMIEPQIRERARALRNNFNELELIFRSGNGITFRLFNEGLAYRFTSVMKDSLTILGENLQLAFAEGDSARFQASSTFNSCWETPYEHMSVQGIASERLCNLPLLVTKKDGAFVMITEADLYNFPGLWLKGTGGNILTGTNAPFPESLTYKGSIYDHGQVATAGDYIARVKGTRTYPWRIFAYAADEKALIANNMVWLLASPSVIKDASWIKPGVVMFDWWGKFNIYGTGFKSGVNTETAKYFIDFCADNGFRYFLFDDGWCLKDDLLHPVEGLDMEEVTAYARSKGVDVMLWVIWHSLQKQMDEAFNQFEKWGIRGIKMDFMNRDDQPMVEFYEKTAAKAAEKRMIVDFHGAYKPCGLSRKYPNVLTREALIEFEYNGWTQYDTPVHHNLLPYIRMFTGAMDYIPATMRNSTKENFRPEADYPMGQGTRAHAMALFVILSSPLTMLPDSPSDYIREKECTSFLSGIPVVWDETRLLEGKVAQYTVMARRSGNNWFIGAITDWNSRSFRLNTGFLPEGRYDLEAVADGVNADRRADDYRKVNMTFTAGEPLDLELAPGGGWIARISPVKTADLRVLPFDLTDVKLLDGPFLNAMKLDSAMLLKYDPDRLLARFYEEAGLKPKAERYMGWENESLAGHSLGHYLSACSMMYSSTGDTRFRERAGYIVKELKRIQDAGGNGYIGAMPKGRSVFENEIAKGDIRAKSFDLNGIWSPFYTIHKIIAGLRDAYRFCGNDEALVVEERFAGWIASIMEKLGEDQVQKMLVCEYGGMNETLADLYEDTNDKRYLELAKRFYDDVVLDAMKEGKDVLPRRHANTNIPKLTGLSRLYELTGDTSDKRAAEFFWNTVRKHHSYVTGGNGFKEYFGAEDSLRNRLGPETTESCNVYNMLKLTGHIFEWSASAEAADFYERALFNHILSSQDHSTGRVTYNLSLGMGWYKEFQDPYDFTCCIGTGMENHSKYGAAIYYHNNDELYVFQYMASELNWKDKGIRLIQKTSFPEEQGSSLVFTCDRPCRLDLKIRYPSWAQNGIGIKVNGSAVDVNQSPGSFVSLSREWKTGDRVEIKMPFSLRTESMPDDPRRIAILYGPLVLAGDRGALADSSAVRNMPALSADPVRPGQWLEPVKGQPNTFVTTDATRQKGIRFTPFYTINDRRYSVYWDVAAR